MRLRAVDVLEIAQRGVIELLRRHIDADSACGVRCHRIGDAGVTGLEKVDSTVIRHERAQQEGGALVKGALHRLRGNGVEVQALEGCQEALRAE